MKKILIVFGTRPEAIKMAPLVKAFRADIDCFDVRVCVTGQHREMLDQVLDFFEIVPEYDLALMSRNQSLFQLTTSIMNEIKLVYDEFSPDYVFVHGDTSTSMVASLAAFYSRIKICHVEAGLRTNNKYSPFPEEMNRQITGRLADFHFAPTQDSKQNLITENINEKAVIVTGNTVLDALFWAENKLKSFSNAEIDRLAAMLDKNKKTILVTGHRRENFGNGFLNICSALKKLSEREDVQIIYPVHLNPQVRQPVTDLLSNISNIKLIEPLGYPAFIWLMTKSHLILTDSGGVQEEAPSLGKPVLVMRDTTERPEAVNAGTVKLVGTESDTIVLEVNRLLDNVEHYREMASGINPYGDGTASNKIVNYFNTLHPC